MMLKPVFSLDPSKILFAVTLVVIIATQAVLARPILDALLLDSVRTPSAKWSTYLLNKVTKTQGTAGGGLSVEEQAMMAGSLSSALSTTTVQQVDLIRLDCMCAVSVGQGLTDTDTNEDGISVADAVDRVLTANIPNGRVVGFGNNLSELDAGQLERIASTGRPEISIVKNAEIASAVFVSAASDQPQVMVRLLMDLRDRASTLKMMLALLGIILTAISAVVILIAYRAVRRSQLEGKMSAEQARFLAERDPLTKHFNRLGFRNRATVLLERCKAKGRRACLIQYDADNLKTINDLHGHPTGDRCLIDIAEQLRITFPSALIARLGSDEFAVLVEEDRMPDGIRSVKGATIDAAARDLAISTTVGFAFFPDDGTTLYQLMKAADLALISAKSVSHSSVIAYHSNMSDSFRKKAWEIHGIQEALSFNQIEPYYQPLVNAKTLELEGVEALVRWNHPDLGTLSPGFFQSALDDPALAIEVTERVLNLMLKDLAGWWSAGHRFSAGLNVGESDLRHSGLFDMINSALEEHGLPPSALAIEVTESAVNAANVKSVLPILQAFRDRGLFVALDDFGTGTSSLTLLRALPRTAIKIDKSFIADVVRDEDDRAIVTSLIKLGHELGIKVVAEGIEDESQASLLRTLGVDVFQGHLYGKAQPASDITWNLNDWTVASHKGSIGLPYGRDVLPPVSRLG